MNAADMRKEYSYAGLNETDAGDDPFILFGTWFHAAINAKLSEPNAMTLATATPSGVPSARIDETNESALEHGRAGTGAAHPVAPPERLATLCSRPATSAGVPPELSSPRKSERCTATRLIEPSVSTSTACQPVGPRRMT